MTDITDKSNEVAYDIKRMMRGQDIGRERARRSMELILTDRVDSRDVMMGGFFAAMTTKGPTKREILGVVEASLELDGFEPHYRDVDVDEPVYSICGCGKTDYKMFNVSTAAAFIAASAGVCITKNGSHGTSKATGATDVVHLLGVNPDVDNDRMVASAESDSIGYFSIEPEIRRFDDVYGGELYFNNPLSFGFAPLVISCDLDGVVYGTMTPDTGLAAGVLREYGLRDSIVVNGTIKPNRLVDEFSVFGENRYSVVREDGIETRCRDFGDAFDDHSPEAVASGSKRENALDLLAVLLGEDDGAKTDMAALNAGAILFAAGRADSIMEGYHVAREKVDAGAPYEKLRALVENSDGDLSRLEEARDAI